MRGFLLAALLVTAFAPPLAAALITYLHHFSGADGSTPFRGLTFDGQRLYGTTEIGGTAGDGVVFAIDPDGSSFEVLHHFDSFVEGIRPQGPLLLNGGRLFGVTSAGGSTAVGFGVAFSLSTVGSDFQIEHTFLGPEGGRPLGELIQVGAKVIGIANQQGSAGLGTVFSFTPNGSDLQALHQFIGAGDGASPGGRLTLVGSRLFGTVIGAGSANSGGIYAMDLDGENYQLLRSFSVSEGGTGQGLVAIADRLYGTTSVSPDHPNGSIFTVRQDGADFKFLHSFSGNDGIQSNGGLITDGTRLFGTTSYGGEGGGAGVVFAIDLDGGNFTVLHDFSDAPGEGNRAWGSLVLAGSILYGVTAKGGLNDVGTIFAITVPEPSGVVQVAVIIATLLIIACKRCGFSLN